MKIIFILFHLSAVPLRLFFVKHIYIFGPTSFYVVYLGVRVFCTFGVYCVLGKNFQALLMSVNWIPTQNITVQVIMFVSNILLRYNSPEYKLFVKLFVWLMVVYKVWTFV